MITVQLPRPTLVEPERLQPGTSEFLRAKQELQWEEIQVQQQHEKIAANAVFPQFLRPTKGIGCPSKGYILVRKKCRVMPLVRGNYFAG